LNLNAASFVATSLSVVMILTFFVFFMSGSLLAVIVFWMVLVLSSVVLWAYGFISNDLLQLFTYSKPPPAPAADKPEPGSGLVGMEVFHVDNNRFTYDEAPAACAAFGGNLATLEQINEAYNNGAEWCGYGWSAGGLALFPTQRGTWETLQQEPNTAKRTACGKVGVNGGYFDPSYKFGVNCYGYKPAASSNLKLPLPPPGTNADAFNAMVAKFQGMLSSFDVSPYSRSQWSGYGALDTGARATAEYGTQFQQNLGGLVGSGAPPAPVKVSTPSTKESFGVRGSDANILDANRPGGYTYIHEPANVEGPGGGKAVPWYMMKNPMAEMGMTGPMGMNGMYGAGHGMGCGCPPCQAAAAAGPTGPMGPMGYTGGRGPTGPMSVGTNVGNAAPVAPAAPALGSPEAAAFGFIQDGVGKIFLGTMNGGTIPPGTVVTAADVARAKEIELSLPQGPLRYNLEIVGREMEKYRATTARTAAAPAAPATTAAPALPTTPAEAGALAARTAAALGVPPPSAEFSARTAATNAAAAATRAAMIAAGQNPDK